MRFEEAYEGWQERRLTQEEAGRLLGMSERNFRRYVGRYEADGLQGLIDRRVEQISSRRAPVDEVMRLVNLYQSRHDGWNVQHFHAWYRRDGVGTRSYTWVKNAMQDCRFRCDQGTPDECAGQFTIGTGRYGPVPQWHGIFADKDDFYSHLRKAGFLFHSEADEIGDAEILALWDIEKKKTAERKKKSS